jgi:hypothetical protein
MAMENIVRISEQVSNIVDDLFLSFKKEQVEDVFSRNSIDDISLRIQLLRKCMHVRDTSNTNEVLSMDDDYNDELEIFLNGTWRMLI